MHLLTLLIYITVLIDGSEQVFMQGIFRRGPAAPTPPLPMPRAPTRRIGKIPGRETANAARRCVLEWQFPLEILAIAGTVGPMFFPRRLCGLIVAVLGFAGFGAPSPSFAQDLITTVLRAVDAETGLDIPTATITTSN